MARFTVKADVDKAQKALKGTALSVKSISRRALQTIARETVRRIKAAAASSTKKRTGELRKSYKYKAAKSGESVTVFPKGTVHAGSGIYPKVMALSYGSEKRHIRAFGFIQAGQDYAENKDHSPEIEKLIQKELKKYWG